MTFRTAAEMLFNLESKAERIAKSIAPTMGNDKAIAYAQAMYRESEEPHEKRLWELVEEAIEGLN
jgi:hypothetical protein